MLHPAPFAVAAHTLAEGGLVTEDFLMAAGIALLTTTLLARVRRNAAKRTKCTSPKERLENIKARTAQRDSINGAMVEAEDLVRRLGAHLDNKARSLESLIDRAERAAAELRSAAEAAHDIPSSTATTGHNTPAALSPEQRTVYALADEGLHPLAIAERLDEHAGKVELILALRRQTPEHV